MAAAENENSYLIKHYEISSCKSHSYQAVKKRRGSRGLLFLNALTSISGEAALVDNVEISENINERKLRPESAVLESTI